MKTLQLMKAALYGLAALFMLSIYSCSTSSSAVQFNPYTLRKKKMDTAYLSSNGMSILVVRHSVSGYGSIAADRHFTYYADSLFADMSDILIQKGFVVEKAERLADIAPTDFSRFDFVLVTSMQDCFLGWRSLKATEGQYLGGLLEVNGSSGTGNYTITGDAQLNNDITFKLAQAPTKVVVKTAEHKPLMYQVQITASKRYANRSDIVGWDDPVYTNTQYSSFKRHYQGALEQFITLTNPEELKKLKYDQNTLQAETFTYDYEPPAHSKTKSAEMSFLLVNSGFDVSLNGDEAGSLSSAPVFSKFIKNMSGDMQELLVAKGYSVVGPFKYWDEIVYSQKKNNNFLLTAQIVFHVQTPNVEHKATKGITLDDEKTTYNTFKGNVLIGATIDITVSEPLSREKLLVKSITLDAKQIACASTDYSKNKESVDEVFADPGFANPIGQFLQGYYTDAMKVLWGSLDIEELKQIYTESLTIKKRVNYSGQGY